MSFFEDTKKFINFDTLSYLVEKLRDENQSTYMNSNNHVNNEDIDSIFGGVGDNEEWYSNYMTIEALEDGLTTTFNMTEGNESVEYCIDNGDWISLSSGEETPSINKGQMIAFKGTLTPMMDYDNWIVGIGTFTISKNCNVSGNVMSMLFGDDTQNNLSLCSKDYAFSGLFLECTTIISAKDLYLPATELAGWCYSGMFSGCTSLTTAPELPATELAKSCYTYMFSGCTSLTTAPELPATELASGNYDEDCVGYGGGEVGYGHGAVCCYEGMFEYCTSLTTAPELPATTLADSCYRNMFYGCTSLTTAPTILPATTLANYCYSSMFGGCSSLTTAPELPATTLANYCYSSMFQGCTSLTTAPELPATTLAEGCYAWMFQDCTSLTTAPELPATTLAVRCYEGMFGYCESLTQAPELPATMLTNQCYSNMFSYCTSLTQAPALPATALTDSCYNEMFYNCTSLNHIKMLATDISAIYYLDNWVKNVASTGTFVKHPDMTLLPTGESGIPEGWTVQDAEI